MSRPTGGAKRPSPSSKSSKGPSGSSRSPYQRGSVPRPRGSRSLAETRTSPISSIGALAVVAVVLLAGLGYGYATRKEAKTVIDATAVAHLPLANATAVCQGMEGAGADSFSTVSTYSPTTTAGKADTATIGFLPKLDNAPFKFAAPGTRAESPMLSLIPTIDDPQGGSPAKAPVVASVSGAYAPGFSLGTLIRTDTGPRRGLAGTQCSGPGTDFWFSDVAYGQDRESRLYLANSDPVPATVILALYGKDGPITPAGGAVTFQLPANSSKLVVLNTVVPALANAKSAPGALHVTTQVGRVSASVLDSDYPADPKAAPTDPKSMGGGMDYIPAQHPSTSQLGGNEVQVIPGIPGAQTALNAMQPTPAGQAGLPGAKGGKLQSIELALTAIGTQNVSVTDVKWITNGPITPSAVTLPISVDMGKTVFVDLSGVPSDGEPGSLQITSNGGPLLAGVRIVDQAPTGTAADTAYLAPAQALTAATTAVVVDDKWGGKSHSYLYLADPTPTGKGATVKITRIGTTGGPVAETVTIPAGQTYTYQLEQPNGQNEFTTVVEPQAGSDPVYATRQIRDQPPNGGIQTTLQVLAPARLTAAVPPVEADLSGAVNR